MPLTTSAKTPDALDFGIIERLTADPSLTSKAIAADIGMPETTVAMRIRAMAEGNVMRVVLQRDFSTLGFNQLCMTYIRVLGRPVPDVMKELAALSNVTSVSLTMGAADIFIMVGARDWDELHTVIDRQIAKIAGIVSIEEDICLSVFRLASSFGDLSALHEAPYDRSTLDDLDEEIIRPLMVDGRVSNREIARNLSLAEGTVRQRLKKLIDTHKVQMIAVCNPAIYGLSAAAIVRLKVTPDAIESVRDELSLAANGEFSFLSRTSGAFDFASIVTAQSDEGIQSVLDRMVRPLQGIRKIEVLKVISSVRHNYTLTHISRS